MKHNNLQLMPFLSRTNTLTYHIRSSEHVKLDTKPNEELTSLLKSLTFYKNRIVIPKTKPQLKQQLEKHFNIFIKENKITNKLLLQFFSTFCETKLLKN